MAFVNAADVRKWLEGISVTDKPDVWFDAVIVESDRWVKLKLSKWPSLLATELPGTVPDFTHALAEAAGVEASLRMAYSEQGESAENSDRKMWQKIRDTLLAQFNAAEILTIAGPATKTMTSNARRANRLPVFGYSKFGEYVRSITLPTDQGGYEVRDEPYGPEEIDRY